MLGRRGVENSNHTHTHIYKNDLLVDVLSICVICCSDLYMTKRLHVEQCLLFVQMAGLSLGPGARPTPLQPQPMGTSYPPTGLRFHDPAAEQFGVARDSHDAPGRGPPPGLPLGPNVQQTYAPSPAYPTGPSPYMSSPPTSAMGPPTSAMGPPTSAMGPPTSAMGPPTSAMGPPTGGAPPTSGGVRSQRQGWRRCMCVCVCVLGEGRQQKI